MNKMKTVYNIPEKENMSAYSGEMLSRDLALITASLEGGYFPFSIPSESDEAHIIYNGSSPNRDFNNGTKEAKGTYLVNFFKQILPEEGRITRGFIHLYPRDIENLEKISNSI